MQSERKSLLAFWFIVFRPLISDVSRKQLYKTIAGLLMPNEWIRSLDGFRYQVAMQNYENADQYPGFFNFPIPLGDRSNTIAFENHFRELAVTNIEVWLEVVFWKMYSQAHRRNEKTNQVAKHLQNESISPQVLLEACNEYIGNDTRANLDAISKLLGFSSRAIAIAATFPAFLRPDLFPNGRH
jgi:hypothetical protein